MRERGEDLVVPPRPPQVPQQRPRGVRDVRRVDAAVGPARERTRRATRRRSRRRGARRRVARARRVVQDPGQLGAREVRVQPQPGRRLDVRAEAVGGEAGADVRPCGGPARRWPGRPARPCAGPTRPSSRAGSRSRRAATSRAVDACRGEARPPDGDGRVADLGRVVLDAAGRGVVLRERRLRDAVDGPGGVEQDGARGRRALVEGEQEGGHRAGGWPETESTRRAGVSAA